MTHSMMSCAARVAMARYRPLMRREGNAEQNADQRGRAAAGQDAEPERHAVAARQDGGGVPPDHHEGALTDGNLPGVADQKIQADGADSGQGDGGGDAHQVLVIRHHQRYGQQGQ